MAYPFYPAYQPAYYPAYQNPVQPTQLPLVNQPVVPQLNQNGILWVDSYEDAVKYPIAPNNALRLWHRTKPIVFFKESDVSGRVTVKTYDLVERADFASDGISEPEDKSPTYVTKDELGTVVGAVKGINEIIESLKTDIDSIKGDLYGIAGKKKGKKVEADADE